MRKLDLQAQAQVSCGATCESSTCKLHSRMQKGGQPRSRERRGPPWTFLGPKLIVDIGAEYERRLPPKKTTKEGGVYLLCLFLATRGHVGMNGCFPSHSFRFGGSRATRNGAGKRGTYPHSFLATCITTGNPVISTSKGGQPPLAARRPVGITSLFFFFFPRSRGGGKCEPRVTTRATNAPNLTFFAPHVVTWAN